MEYYCKTINIIEFIYPAEHMNDVYSMLDGYCEFEDDCWLIKRDNQIIISINRESTPFPNNEFSEEISNEPIMQERLALIDSPYSFSVCIYLGFDDVVCCPEELYRLVELFLATPLRYVLDGYLWTWIEIAEGFSLNGQCFLDFYSQYYGGGPYISFSTDGLATQHIAITDNIIEDWYKGGLSELKTFSYNDEPMTGIDRYGTTTIPVQSISQFREIIKKSTSEHFVKVSKEKLDQLLAFLDIAQRENKPVIVDGV